MGFWQGAFRDVDDPAYPTARKVIEAHEPWSVEVLYGGQEGGQRVVTRFSVLSRHSEDGDWITSVARHWNIDRPDPR